MGLVGHWPAGTFPYRRVPVLLHLLLLLRHPRLPLLLLQGAVGTRATPLPELAETFIPSKTTIRPTSEHRKNIWYLTRIYRPSREIYTESYFFTPKKCNFVYKIQYLHTTRWIYSKSLQMFSTYLFKTLCK